MSATRKYQPKTFSPSLFRRSLSAAPITALQYRILVELCEHSQMDKPVVKPGLDRLAENCGCTRAAICTNLNKLQGLGYIQKVGAHIGGNSGAGKWRLVYGGMRERADGRGPIWDPQKMDSDLFSERCPDCSALSTPVAQLSTQTLSTVNADALNCQPPLTLSSHEVERSDYEVDAYACGATRPPDGGATRLGAAQEKQPDQPSSQIPISGGDASLKVFTWPEWLAYTAPDEGNDLPAARPPHHCGRESHRHLGGPAPGCEPCTKAAALAESWNESHKAWLEDTSEKRAAISDCQECDPDGLRFDADGRAAWCAHQTLRNNRNAAQMLSEAKAAFVEKVYQAVLAVHGASGAAYVAQLARDRLDTIDNLGGLPGEDSGVLETAIKLAGHWLAENEAAAKAAVAAANLQTAVADALTAAGIPAEVAAAAAQTKRDAIGDDTADRIDQQAEQLVTKIETLAAEETEPGERLGEIYPAVEAWYDTQQDRLKELACVDCGGAAGLPKWPGAYLMDRDGSPVVAVFPPGRTPLAEDSVDVFTMPLGDPAKPVGVVTYAQIKCQHFDEWNQQVCEELVKDYGAAISSLAQISAEANGGIGATAAIADRPAAEQLSRLVAPAIEAAAVVDAELADLADAETPMDVFGGSLGEELSGAVPLFADVVERGKGGGPHAV